ncbi:hypothetical protein OSTOST_00337, partial [Ostertagia ostertagi]
MPGYASRNYLLEAINSKFTSFSLGVAACIEARTLLNVPEKQWKVFSVLVYTHIAAAVSLCCIEARTLLNVPEKQWKVFSVLVYTHIAAAVSLCIFGIVCFCLGMVHSSLYTEVSCSNGVNFFMPFINVVSSFAGLIAVRALHMIWPPFVHLVTLSIAFPSLLIVATVTYIEADVWYAQSSGTPEPIPAGVEFTNWAKVFADLDVLITFVVLFNMLIIGGEFMVYFKYWYLRMDRARI